MWRRRGSSDRSITRVDEYDGRSAVSIFATQLDARTSPRQARTIVDGWCAFFAAGPTPITELRFTSRTPSRLFTSLAAQTQLRTLHVKWGDYGDLSPLAGMRELAELRLGGATRVRSLSPLAELPGLLNLSLVSLRDVHDLSPLGALTALRALWVGGDGFSPRVAHVDSIAFLRRLPQLEQLVLDTIIVDDKDYSPLLGLPGLSSAWVEPVRGMRPSHAELCAAIPALRPPRT
ncbi:MAG TPA: hypothetical protein VGK92_03790 [Gaiellales bacterium]